MMSKVSYVLYCTPTRIRCLAGLLLSLTPLVLALVFQHINDLVPCHLCIFQRVAYIAAACVFFLGLLFNPTWNWARRTYSFFASLFSIIGLALAGRQVWLQHLPADQVPSCGASLDFMMEVLPLTDVISRVLKGTGECATVDWSLLGMSMAQWSAISLTTVLLAAIWISMPKNSVVD